MNENTKFSPHNQGVTGSSPVGPTFKVKHLQRNLQVFFLFGGNKVSQNIFAVPKSLLQFCIAAFKISTET